MPGEVVVSRITGGRYKSSARKRLAQCGRSATVLATSLPLSVSFRHDPNGFYNAQQVYVDIAELCRR